MGQTEARLVAELVMLVMLVPRAGGMRLSVVVVEAAVELVDVLALVVELEVELEVEIEVDEVISLVC